MKCEGIPASGGIGIGEAVLVAEPDLGYGDVVFSGVEAEKARLAGAVAAFIRETSAMAEALREQLGDKQAEILSGQVMMVSDPYMTSQMNAAIENGVCAESAVDSVCGMYIELFSSMEDELMRQRALDVEDLRRRLLSILLGRPRTELNRLPPGSVLVARDFTPSMTAGLRRENVAAIVTESGGRTSHSAILARTMSLPAVLSVPNITDLLSGGETLVVDGSAGTVLVNPDEEVLRACRSRQAEELARQADLIRFRSRPTRTADGEAVSLCCNIAGPRDVPSVLEHTGEGVGLFRTEFLFMNRSAPPSEEEQFRIYQDAARRLLGELLEYLLTAAGGDLRLMRARALELMAVLSRAAVDGGGDEDMILDLNCRCLSEIDCLRTAEDLALWLTQAAERFVSSVLALADVRHRDIIYKAIEYLRRNCRGRVTLEDTARHVGLSPSYFSRVFKEAVGESFNSYLGALRISRSRDMLLNTDASIAEICDRCGFDDQSYFTKVFRKYTGVTPGRFRARRGRPEAGGERGRRRA